MKKETKTVRQTTSKPKRRGLAAWLVRNLGLLVAAYVIWTFAGKNPGIQWLIEGYAKQNLMIAKTYPDATYDQRMEMKLGADYDYLIYLRDNTPPDAIIYYPTRADFQTVLPGQEKSPFSGQLIDKLTAVRVLYPRRVITTDEWGKTSWAKKTNFVAVVNRCNLDKVHYAVDSAFVIGVLPVDSNQVVTLPEAK